jgi:hypothetical protein
VSKFKYSLWTIRQVDGDFTIDLIAMSARDAAVVFVRDHRRDLNGSAVAKNGTIIYGNDGQYYSIDPWKVNP